MVTIRHKATGDELLQLAGGLAGGCEAGPRRAAGRRPGRGADLRGAPPPRRRPVSGGPPRRANPPRPGHLRRPHPGQPGGRELPRARILSDARLQAVTLETSWDPPAPTLAQKGRTSPGSPSRTRTLPERSSRTPCCAASISPTYGPGSASDLSGADLTEVNLSSLRPPPAPVLSGAMLVVSAVQRLRTCGVPTCAGPSWHLPCSTAPVSPGPTSRAPISPRPCSPGARTCIWRSAWTPSTTSRHPRSRCRDAASLGEQPGGPVPAGPGDRVGRAGAPPCGVRRPRRRRPRLATRGSP